jgi:hypothetical protein
MIDSLFFILQIIGVSVLLGWALLNDKTPDDGESRGPLAFKPPPPPFADGQPDRYRNGGLTRRRRRATLFDRMG